MIVTDRTIRLIATPDPAAMNPGWSQVIIHKAGRQKHRNAERVFRNGEKNDLS